MRFILTHFLASSIFSAIFFAAICKNNFLLKAKRLQILMDSYDTDSVIMLNEGSKLLNDFSQDKQFLFKLLLTNKISVMAVRNLCFEWIISRVPKCKVSCVFVRFCEQVLGNKMLVFEWSGWYWYQISERWLGFLLVVISMNWWFVLGFG